MINQKLYKWRFYSYLLLIKMILFSNTSKSFSMDFIEKRQCTIDLPNRALLHTKCVISGGISNGALDIDVRITDGRRFTIFGYLDKATDWTLNNEFARQTSVIRSNSPICIRSEKLEVCIGDESN